MGFWLYCTVMCLLVPAVMLYFGWRFLNRPPKKINALYGYRTSQVCGKLWFWAGIVMLPLSLLAMLPGLGKDMQVLGIWLMGVVLVQVVVMIATIFPVEKALKRKFDKFGRRIG